MTGIGGTTPPPGAASGWGVLRYAAFTDHGRGGNPAGVVLDAAGLDDPARLAIAARVGYSETAFVEAKFMLRLIAVGTLCDAPELQGRLVLNAGGFVGVQGGSVKA